MRVAEAESHETALLLLEWGVVVEAMDEDEWTPLMWAAGEGREVVAELLLEWGPAVEVTDEGGRTPLLCAAEKGHKAVVKLLLARDSVDLDFKDFNDQTPLSRVAEKGHKAVVKLVLARVGRRSEPLVGPRRRKPA
jgi:ankyrin repeat protein